MKIKITSKVHDTYRGILETLTYGRGARPARKATVRRVRLTATVVENGMARIRLSEGKVTTLERHEIYDALVEYDWKRK